MSNEFKLVLRILSVILIFITEISANIFLLHIFNKMIDISHTIGPAFLGIYTITVIGAIIYFSWLLASEDSCRYYR